MQKFFWRITICVVPLLVSALIVGNALYNYFQGKGGFKLGVDLAGGTILIYEVDVEKFPDGKLPSNWDPKLLATRLKSRIDPGDIYNITIRVASSTRFEIILPTGGKHQVVFQEKIWRDLVSEIEKEYPIRTYVVPVGRKVELLAEVYSQYAKDMPNDPAKQEEVEKENKDLLTAIEKLINDNYKFPLTDTPTEEQKKAWNALIAKVSEKENYPPKQYLVGRGKTTELVTQILQQHEDADLKEISKLVNPDQAGGASQRKSKRGQSMTEEQVQERKELIAAVGSLEFKIVANRPNDSDAIEAAVAYFKKVKENPALQSELDRLAFLGKPPPSPVPPNGDTFHTSIGDFTYSWVELGTLYRHDHGLANPRDKKTDQVLVPPVLPEAPKDAKDRPAWVEQVRKAIIESQSPKDSDHWIPAAEARANGELYDLNGMGWIYSRLVKKSPLPEKDRDKRIEYFILMRDTVAPNKPIIGDDIAYAAAGMTGNVEFRIKPAEASRFYDFTKANIGQLMGIVLDGYLESSATIQSAISTNGQITMHGAPPDKIQATVRVLRSGQLPATLKPEPVSESTMGPTLGADTIWKGSVSVLGAFAAVLIFMLFYYRFAGLVACVALFANLLLTLAFMVTIDATFTLPGLAGLVLMLGMAVDANVLIYERLREERERGASLSQALRNGYDHAFPTIIDTHLSSIFTAIVLYVVGNDQLKGFGISLTVGLIISLFTSLYMTRVMFDFWLSRNWLKKLSMLRLFHRPNFNFMAIRYQVFAATAIITVLGAALFIYRLDRGGLNIDFVGGVAYAGELTKPVSIQELRDKLEGAELPDLSVEQIFINAPGYTDGNKSKLFTIRTAKIPEKSPEEYLKHVQKVITEKLGADGANLLKTINLENWVLVPGGKEVYLSFVDPISHAPTFASRAQVSMLLTRELKAQGLEQVAQQFTLEGLGKENEGRFEWMELHFVDPVKDKDKAKLEAALTATQKMFRDNPQPERLENFDSQLAAKTQQQALYAIIASWGAILLYLWFRFGNWTFGAAAVLCLIHDLFWTLGVIAGCHYLSIWRPELAGFLGIQDFKLDLPSVAALLTLVGYSVNDTIVVFDRIREVRGKNPALTPQMINDAVNQTLSRTILASLATWLVVIVLYIFGGEGVHLFAFVMVVGVIIGTLSSIYVASPLLLIFGEGHTAGPAARDRVQVPAAEV
jgi:SecD/SecF fusion protein